MEFIEQNWLKILQALAAIASIVIFIIKVQRKAHRINPVFIKRSSILIREKIISNTDLVIEYKGQATKNFTVTNIALWNAGKKTIKIDDVASTNKFRITAKEGVKIFDAIILKKSLLENKVEIDFNEENNIVEIDFEYLDYNHGVAIQVSHNGTNSNDIEILGTFKSHGKIISFENEAKKTLMNDVLETQAKNFIPSADDKKNIFRLLTIVACVLFLIAFFGNALFLSIVLGIHAILYFALAVIFRLGTKTPKEFEFIEE